MSASSQQLLRCSLLLLIAVLPLAGTQAQPVPTKRVSEQVYVPPLLWPGVLILQSGTESSGTALAQPDAKLLAASLASKDSRILIVVDPAAASAPELSGLAKDRESQVTVCDPTEFCSKLVDNETVAAWAQSETIWIESSPLFATAIAGLDAALHDRLNGCLEQVLSQGGFIRISGDLSWLGTQVAKNRYALLKHCELVSSQPNSPLEPTSELPLVQLYLPSGSRCAFTKRQLVCMSSASPADEQGNTKKEIQVLVLPTGSYTSPLQIALKEGASLDWVQWQRALHERQVEVFPGKDNVGHALVGGSLVIGGGGGMPDEVWKRFVELAGGKNSRIVILPTAVEEPKSESSFEARVLKLAGAGHVVTLPQVARDEVEQPDFLSELDQATGVWFGGGRQWRFVDAYWGTPAWEKLRDVCRRGGVIGGSSAGATIQGDLLVRGAPAGNHIMIAEGYRRGLGLIPGVAIDQHFAQRNRFRELEGCLEAYPTITGIGIDEQTALVVTAPNRCSVMGTGSVWLYPSSPAEQADKTDSVAGGSGKTRAMMRVEHPSGSEFLLPLAGFPEQVGGRTIAVF